MKKKKWSQQKTIIKFPYSDLNQGCPDWKAGVLTTTLTVLAGRDNYNIHIGKKPLFNVDYGGMSLLHHSFLQVDVIRKREHSLGCIIRQVNSDRIT